MAKSNENGKTVNRIYEVVIVLLLMVIVALCVTIVIKRSRGIKEPTTTENVINTPEPTEKTPDVTAEITNTPVVTSTPYVEELADYTGRIEHIFFHSLIAFPELAYSSSNKESLVSTTWFKDFVTVNEFKKILDALYQDGYMLINMNDTYVKTDINGEIKYEIRKPLKFPKGKKPLIMSFDDTNYYHDKQGFGTVDKLILSKNGKVVSYTKMKNGDEIISDDNEFIPIIDKFVEEHPDFSYKGAKGMICLTGFEGVLGYRTQRDSLNRDEEINNVKPIIKALKDTGWYFASHSYKHGKMANYDVGNMKDCAQKFKNEVIPLIGETKLYVYPYGSWKVGPVQQVLISFGFEYFSSVGANYYIKTRSDMSNVVFQDRLNIDGFTLMHNGPLLIKYKDLGTPRFPSLKVEEIFSEEDRRISWAEAKEIHARLYNIAPRE